MVTRRTVNAVQPRQSCRRKRPPVGQHFLADRSAAQRIVDALGDVSQQTVLEIGPGKGVLTDLLVPPAGRLIAVELDRMLAAALRMKYRANASVEIIEGDILAMDLGTLLGSYRGVLLDRTAGYAPRRAQVIGNLPYYISSEILLRLFEFHELFERIVIMLQKEVADRLAARPGSRDYGLLSATAQLFARVEKLFTLSPGAFSPPPRVHSTVVRLTISPRAAELRVDQQKFLEFLKVSFAQKRKTLLNNLRDRYGEEAVRRALAEARVRADVRAEALPLEKAAAIYRALRTAP